jgi:5S rRNA maturation endonuclease (ribonuclease M5)
VNDSDRKGTVENAVKHTQETALKGRKFESIEAQNEWLMHWESQWASLRIHGRAKRQVEEMFQEERPYLLELPLMPFRYFQQETRTVYDDGTIQVGQSYYAANPAQVGSEVMVRISEKEIEILDPRRMEIIRRHPKSRRAGSLMMDPGDRVFNPSRETDRLLAQAEGIGPHTFALCESWFNEEGRNGQRRMYGLLNLVRRYPARFVEQASKLALDNGLKSSRALRRMVENMAAEAVEKNAEAVGEFTQEHPLIRSGKDYAAFFDQHAAQAPPAAEPVPRKGLPQSSPIISREQLPQIWKQASWLKVIQVFRLSVDDNRRSRDDEIWIKSPFTQEQWASMHVSLSANIYKDFSSGKGGGIMQFCREMLRQQGREMGMFEVAQWMVEVGISTVLPQTLSGRDEQPEARAADRPQNHTNRAIKVDLRRYLRSDHPEWARRGISATTCRYLGCGFLPKSTTGASSPLNSRLVFQIRGIREDGSDLHPTILSHVGRALNREQEESDGKYWGYPFRKGLEIYNQDRLVLDEEASRQTSTFGLVLVEGFFDVAKLVEAGCRNVAALMGTHVSAEQLERLTWIRSRLRFPRIVLFLDRDQAGQDGAREVGDRLGYHNLEVTVFDWDGAMSWNGQGPEPIPSSIQDPGDMSVEQLQWLRSQSLI